MSGFNALPYMSMGIGISISIIALLYMFYRITGKKEYVVFAKSQLVDIIIVVILFLSYNFFDVFMNDLVINIDPIGFSNCGAVVGLSPSQLGNFHVFFEPIPKGMPCYQGTALLFLSNLIYEIKYFIIQLTALQSVNGIVETVSFENYLTEALGHNMQYTGVPGLLGIAKIVTIHVKNLSSYLLNSAIFIFFQRYLILFFYYTGGTIFGVGLFLRLFPVSRKIGGLLMAIVLAFMLVAFPIYAVFDNIYKNTPVSKGLPNSVKDIRLVRVQFGIFINENSNSVLSRYMSVENSMLNGKYSKHFDKFVEDQEKETEEESNNLKRNWLQGTLSTLENLIKGIFNFFKGLFIDSIKNIWDFIKMFFDVLLTVDVFLLFENDIPYFVFGGIHLNVLDLMIEDVSNILVYSYLMSLIVTISLVAVIKDLSPLLGGDIEIAGLSHLL